MYEQIKSYSTSLDFDDLLLHTAAAIESDAAVAQEFRDRNKEFTRRDAVVLGVSRDSLASHGKFKLKQALNFELVADTDETWCKAFDVIHEKVLYGKAHLGIVRSTFLVGPDGKLRREWRGVRVKGHVDEVLAALKELAA